MHRKCDRQLECCGLFFSNKAALREHVMVFHNSGYSCKHCDRNFCRKALLKRHLAVHSGKKDFACHLCDYASSHKSNLDRHKKVHGKKCFQCPQCKYATDRKNNLKRHLGTMHKDCGKVLQCCNSNFTSKAALRDHIFAVHKTGYRCQHC
ncbi:hypothetical protein HELRODRAFT_62884, partial [Helobdella robusta]|uniref:C2H2-type domain-containing protein n=1 Tax=Helobdella robusta TaxID=6412 RepID=T1FX66_HELRO